MGRAMADFAHLHLHPLYSLLDGAIRLPDLMKSCAETGMKSVAVTDHGNMFGVVNFYQEAKKHGIKPIIGLEAYVAGDKGRADRSQRIGNHLVLLGMNDAGYRNLRYLSTKAFTEGFYYDPRVDKEILRGHNEGVIALTACMAGAVPQALRRGAQGAAPRRPRRGPPRGPGAEGHLPGPALSGDPVQRAQGATPGQPRPL